jgi:hypothetical protein
LPISPSVFFGFVFFSAEDQTQDLKQARGLPLSYIPRPIFPFEVWKVVLVITLAFLMPPSVINFSLVLPGSGSMCLNQEHDINRARLWSQIP